MTQQTTEAAIRAAIEAEGWIVPRVSDLIEATWRRVLGSRVWAFTDLRDTATPAYNAEAIPFPPAHADALVWGVIGRMAFRSGQYQAARYAEAIYRDRHDDLVLAYAIEDLR